MLGEDRPRFPFDEGAMRAKHGASAAVTFGGWVALAAPAVVGNALALLAAFAVGSPWHPLPAVVGASVVAFYAALALDRRTARSVRSAIGAAFVLAGAGAVLAAALAFAFAASLYTKLGGT